MDMTKNNHSVFLKLTYLLLRFSKMAEARKPTSAEDASNVVCGICLEQFKDPKILPCSHTFCLDCLQRTLNMKEERAKGQRVELQQEPERKYKLETDREAEPEESEIIATEAVYSDEVQRGIHVQTQKIACPVCKREHTVPSEGLSHLPVDLEALQTIEYEQLQKSLSKSEVSQKCASCSKEKTITSHCDVCRGICQRCTDAHREFGVFAQHNILPIDELTRETFGVKKSAHLCSRHGKAVTMYCNSCSLVICHVCIVKQHQSHSLSLLEEVDEKIQERVRQQSEAVQQTLKVYEGYHRYIAGVEGEVVGESYNAKLKAKVNKEFDAKIKRLQDERERLVNYIDSYDSQSKKQVWSEKQAIELVLNKIQAGLRMAAKAQRCVNPADRIAMNAQGSKILDEVNKSTWSHESLPTPLVFQRSSEYKKEFTSFLKQLCDKSSSTADWSSSCDDLAPITERDVTVGVVNEDGSKVTNPKMGQPTIVEVTFKVGMVEEPKFQILYGKSRQVLDSIAAYEISELKSWNIEFVPRCAGTHFVQVWLGGLAVATKGDIIFNGQPKIGSKVQPGPDWTPPDDTTLYFEGVVTNAALHSVEVDWMQNSSTAQEVTPPTRFAPIIVDSESVNQSESVAAVSIADDIGKSLNIELSESEPSIVLVENTTDAGVGVMKMKGVVSEVSLFEVDEGKGVEEGEPVEIEDYEPRPKRVHKKHKWGGFDDKYEVELIL